MATTAVKIDSDTELKSFEIYRDGQLIGRVEQYYDYESQMMGRVAIDRKQVIRWLALPIRQNGSCNNRGRMYEFTSRKAAINYLLIEAGR